MRLASKGSRLRSTGTARVWQYTYDGYGQVLTATDPNGKVTTTVYYAATDPDLGKRGNVQTITNPLGHVTTITAYDLNGRPLSITDPNGVRDHADLPPARLAHLSRPSAARPPPTTTTASAS